MASVTHWISALKAGDHEAAYFLWERYGRRLVTLARQAARKARGITADEEDIALSAFDSFCRGAERGQFPRLADRDDLWKLLVVITQRKAYDLLAYEGRQKRAGKNLPASAPQDLFAPDPDPAIAALFADQCRHLFDCLGDAELRSIASWKLEGYTNGEIAAKLGCVRRRVDRRLVLIRAIWSRELDA